MSNKWNTISNLNNYKFISCNNTGQYICSSTNTQIYLSLDYGITWTNSIYTSTNNIVSLALMIDGNNIIILLNDNDNIRRLVSSDNGNTWSNNQVFNDNSFGNNTFAVSNNNYIYTICTNNCSGVILSSNDYGITWNSFTPIEQYRLIECSDNGQYIVLTYPNVLGNNEMRLNTNYLNSNNWVENVGSFNLSNRNITDISFGTNSLILSIYNNGIYQIFLNNLSVANKLSQFDNSSWKFCLFSTDESKILAYGENNDFISLWDNTNNIMFNSNNGISNYNNFQGSNNLDYMYSTINENNNIFKINNGFINFGTLTYEINGGFTGNLPIINTDNSFTTLSSTEQNNIVSVDFEYTEIINNDGFYFFNMNLGYNIIKIISFGGIPFSRGGSQLRDYTGILPDDLNDTPTILTNTSGKNMFLFTTFNSGIGKWNVENIINFERAFQDNSNFNEDLNDWNVSNVNDMDYMFLNSSNNSSFNGNISNWNTSKVTSMHTMFGGCIMFNQNINTKSVVQDSNEYSAWDVSNVIVMRSMFSSAFLFNHDLSNWDTRNVQSMDYMFLHNNAFNQDLSSWDISNVVIMNNMLDNTSLSVDNYDATLNGWSDQQVKSNVILGALGLEYSSTGEVGRNILINDYNWDIRGDILICFIKDTMILILENGIEVERKVQELKNGDMVKISNGEYKKLVFIGTKTIDITKNIDKIRIMKQGTLGNNLPNKDLLVTSGHSVLFKNLENINEYYNENVYDNNVEGYYKIMSQHCKLFEYVKEEELENIRDGNNVSYYHFVLENEDEEGQYGVYSNGILSETMALSFSKKNYMNKN